jgi:hypothetical protein
MGSAIPYYSELRDARSERSLFSEEKVMKSESPRLIMVKVTINDNLADDLKQTEGAFDHYQPAQQLIETPEELWARQEGREQKRVAQAQELQLDPYRFVTAGRAMADSGIRVFGEQGERNVSLKHVPRDIAEQFPEFSLVSLNIQRRQMGKNLLWMVYSRPSEGRKAIVPSGAERYRIGLIVDSIYGHCHVWRNPAENSITINVGAPQNEKSKNIKDLRILCVART